MSVSCSLLFADLFLNHSPCTSERSLPGRLSIIQRAMKFSVNSPTIWYFGMLAPIHFCLISFLLTPVAIAAPAPEPAPANGDPCGPVKQDNPNYPDTCSVAPVLVESPQPYGINCSSTSGLPVSWGNCSASFHNACTKALDSRTRPGRWVWSALEEFCAIGFFLPPYQGAAQLLNNTRCLEIFAAMTDTCSTSVPASNFASVNLKTLPGHPPATENGQGVYDGHVPFDSTFKGDAVNVGYPSYAINYMAA